MKKKIGIFLAIVVFTCVLGLTACGTAGKDGINGADGSNGTDGKSAYDIWIENGNTGTRDDFLSWLKGLPGDKGDDGESAYDIWLGLGNTGTKTDFLDWLKDQGATRYTITFETDNDQQIEPLSLLKGDKIPRPADPVKTGSTFCGWYVSDDFAEESYWMFYGYPVSGNMTLYAKWTVNTYTVSFNANGGNNAPTSVTVSFGAQMPAISVIPTKTDSVFMGFFDAYIAGNKYYNSDLSSDRTWDKPINAMLYARWRDTNAGATVISTKTQLIEFANQVNGGEKFNGAFFELGADIDLADAEWTPIGDSTNFFGGTFDGVGFSVSNFKITDVYAGQYAGLFGYLKNGAIKNLSVKNYTINTACQYAGGLVAYNDYGRISSCYSSGNINSDNNAFLASIYAGGLIGRNYYGNIIGCVSAMGDIQTVNIAIDPFGSARTYAYGGGLMGENFAGTINDCYTANKVSSASKAYSYAGGLTGANSYGGQINNCSADGEVSSEARSSGCSSLSGGLTGDNNNSQISYCHATGNVFGSLYVGGLVGHNNNSSIIYSYATGNVTAHTYFSYAGGLVGSMGLAVANGGTITGCFATGNVTATMSAATTGGGLLGQLSNGTVNNCYATGNVTTSSQYSSESQAGGLIGNIGSSGNISNCYASGNISASAVSGNFYAGGLVGINYGTITNCIALGRADMSGSTTSGSFAGGNVGNISNSYRYSKQPSGNTIGAECSLTQLNTASFYTGTLGWNDNIWELSNLNYLSGKRPVFKTGA